MHCYFHQRRCWRAERRVRTTSSALAASTCRECQRPTRQLTASGSPSAGDHGMPAGPRLKTSVGGAFSPHATCPSLLFSQFSERRLICASQIRSFESPIDCDIFRGASRSSCLTSARGAGDSSVGRLWVGTVKRDRLTASCYESKIAIVLVTKYGTISVRQFPTTMLSEPETN